jgi:hypothetical protein
VLGTPQYISPEQAMAKKDLNEGTDIYSFGVMLYEMTVGRVPFSADTPFSVIHDHIYAPLPLPSTVNPNISSDLERVLLKALAKERADRYADVPAFVEAFKDAWSTSASTVAVSMPVAAPDAVTIPPIASQTSQPSSPITIPVFPAAEPAATPASDAVSDTASKRRRKKGRARWMWAVSPIGLCLCCVFIFVFVWRGNNKALPIAPPASLKDAQATVIAAVPVEVGPTVEAAMQTAMPQPPTEQPPQDTAQSDKIDLVSIDLDSAKADVDKNPDNPRVRLAYGFAPIQNKEEKNGYFEIKKAAELGAKNPLFLNSAARALDKANLPLGAAAMYLQLGIQARETDQNLDNNLLIDLRRTIYDSFDDPIAPGVFDYSAIEKVHPPLALVAQARYAITNSNDPQSALKVIDELCLGSRGMPEADLLQAELFIVTKQDLPGAQKLLEGILQMPRVPGWIIERVKELQSAAK